MLRRLPLAASSSLLALAVATPALATEVRSFSLGNPAGLDDEVQVFTYPSLVNRYSLVLGELGTRGAGFKQVGTRKAYIAAMTQTSAGSFGVALSREQSLFTFFDTELLSANDPDFVAVTLARYSLGNKYAGTQTDFDPARPIDLFYGLPLGEDQGWGVRLTLAGDTDETKTEAVSTKKNAEQLDLHLGYHMPVGTGRLDLGLKVGVLGKAEIETQATNGPKAEDLYDRGLPLRLSARVVEIRDAAFKPFYKASLGYATPALKPVGPNNPQAKKRKGKEFDIDVQGGVIASPTERVQLNAGVSGFMFQSEGPYTLAKAAADPDLQTSLRNGTELVDFTAADGKTKRKGYGLVATFGAEALATESFGLLTGVKYSLWGRLVTEDGISAGKPKYTTNLAETTDGDLWAFGLFFKRDAFRVDASAAIKNFLHEGPNFITGGRTDPLLAQIAGSYRF